MSKHLSIFHENELASMRQWHAPYAAVFKNSEKVLDLGCGTGIFIALLQESKIKVIGIDPDEGLVECLKFKGYTVYHGNQDDLNDHAPGCDGIHISHVIEHLWGNQLRQLFEDCVDSLPDNGLLVIRTPNWANRNVSGGGFWDDYTHTRPYSLRQLVKMLQSMGMSITSSGYEPFGWEDTFVIARKNPTELSPADSDTPIFPAHLRKLKPSLLNKIRIKVRNWLNAD